MLPVGVQYFHLSGHMRKLWLLVSKRSKTAWLSDSSACFAKQGQPKVSRFKRLVRYGRSFQVLVNLRVATYEPSQFWLFWLYSLKSSDRSICWPPGDSGRCLRGPCQGAAAAGLQCAHAEEQEQRAVRLGGVAAGGPHTGPAGKNGRGTMWSSLWLSDTGLFWVGSFRVFLPLLKTA